MEHGDPQMSARKAGRAPVGVPPPASSGLTAVQAASPSPDVDPYQYFCQQVSRFAQGAVVVASSFDSGSGSLCIRGVEGLTAAKRKAVEAALGGRLVGLTLTGLPPKARDILSTGRFHRTEGGPRAAFLGQVSPDVWRKLEDLPDSLEAHAVGMRRGDKLLGCLTILSTRPDTLNSAAIEALANVAAVALERKQNSDALRHSEGRLGAILAAMHDPLLVFDLSGRILFVSIPESESHLRPRQMLGRLYSELFPPDVDRLFQHALQQCREGNAAEYDYSLPIGGRQQWCSAKLSPMFDGGRIVGAVAVVRNITERKRLEAQVIQSQKMEAVGQLAGGIAHDFRNQLTVIRGYSEMLLRRGMKSAKSREQVREILKAANRSSCLAEQLLSFSHQGDLQPRTVSLREQVDDLAKALHRLIGEDIRLSVAHRSDSCVAKVDPQRFQQAVMNLAINARDAMPRGGSLVIETGRRTLEPRAAEALGGRGGQYVSVTVTDSGVGMDPATLARAFEPFFTTKPAGWGTGLGLSLVYGFVRQSGGLIECDSTVGAGTRIRLHFPAVSGPAEAATAEAATAVPGGSERILIVEDDPNVRKLLAGWLTEAGYHVRAKADPSAAVKSLAAAPGRADVLISDVVLPGMTGTELASRAQAVLPNLAVLYVSGYCGKDLLRRGVEIPSAAMLVKPFSRAVLLARLRDLLEGRARS
jgi:PAS domain S-box-containing protein